MDIKKVGLKMWVTFPGKDGHRLDGEVVAYDVDTQEVLVRHNCGEETFAAADLKPIKIG